MNRNIYFYSVFSFFLLLVGCQDSMDIEPDGQKITSEKKAEVITKMPDRLRADINGLYSWMIAYGSSLDDDEIQSDFGAPALAMRTDINGQDIVSDITGYNWFSEEQSFKDRDYTKNGPYHIWRFYYRHISQANDIIKIVPEDTDQPLLKASLGQALATRAYDYLNLVQLYQFNYVGHENAPAVPIVTEKTTYEEGNNNPRATVKEVYDFLMKDLDKAIKYLEGYSRPANNAINQAVAYGIRARANLAMGNWKAAADDAEKALSLSGATPFSRLEVSVPNFDDAQAHPVLWGCIISDKDRCVTTGICNWTSMFCSLCYGYGGYTTLVRTWKKINVLLYDQIPDSDVRKGWWLNKKGTSPLLNSFYLDQGKAFYKKRTHKDYPTEEPDELVYKKLGMSSYANVKFAPNEKDPLSASNSSDFILMRAEEMILIQAEALAMAGEVEAGKKILVDFVRDYRNPDFTCGAASAKEVQDAVWFQRRIELWGEGLSWFDIMRLKKPIIRKENGKTNFGSGAIFNIAAESPVLLWSIPRSEIQANKGISEDQNNQTGSLPESDTPNVE